MGQIFRRMQELEEELTELTGRGRGRGAATTTDGGGPDEPRRWVSKKFPDLMRLPPELSLLILSKLNATDLYLASCVWHDLASDEVLWQGLCYSEWAYCSAYKRKGTDNFSFKRLYLKLDEATVSFNGDYELGVRYLLENDLIENDSLEIAKFLHGARRINWENRRQFLDTRRDVLEKLVALQNFENQFLPNALRRFFTHTHPPNDRGSYLQCLVEQFSTRFCQCNPQLGLSKDTVYVVCFSLIMLSVDLTSPHIKNKMSKREFIRNTRRAAEGVNDDFAGHLYDNIYLRGHIVPKV